MGGPFLFCHTPSRPVQRLGRPQWFLGLSAAGHADAKDKGAGEPKLGRVVSSVLIDVVDDTTARLSFALNAAAGEAVWTQAIGRGLPGRRFVGPTPCSTSARPIFRRSGRPATPWMLTLGDSRPAYPMRLKAVTADPHDRGIGRLPLGPASGGAHPHPAYDGCKRIAGRAVMGPPVVSGAIAAGGTPGQFGIRRFDWRQRAPRCRLQPLAGACQGRQSPAAGALDRVVTRWDLSTCSGLCSARSAAPSCGAGAAGAGYAT